MESALSKLQENFRAKTDDELLSLALNGTEMTLESRLVLLEELQRRVKRVKEHPTKIQLVHGWYTVIVDGADVSFPPICPKCVTKSADRKVSVTSRVHTKNRLVYTKHQNVTLEFPHCRACANRISRRNKLISWLSYSAHCMVCCVLDIPLWATSGLLRCVVAVSSDDFAAERRRCGHFR